MSFDYLLIKGPAALAGTSARDENMQAVLMAFAEAFTGESIGSLDAVKASLLQLIPSLRWRQQKFEIPPHLLVAELGNWSWSTTSQADLPEFSLGADGHGQVRAIAAAQVHREELERIGRALGLVVLDEQALEILTG
jgi:hypothetical protein